MNKEYLYLMTMRPLTLNDVHQRLLEIASVFHRLCEKHGIPYYMLGGSMLGAIRHKGFIPWDDDMDFGIPREHYVRFVEVAVKELPEPYQLITYATSEYAMMGFAKMMDVTTRVEEEFQPRSNETLGVNIDIFPLDHCDEKCGIWSGNFRTRALFKLQKLLFVEAKNRPLPKKILAKTAQLLIPISRTRIPKYQDMKLSTRSKGDVGKYNCYANYFGAWGLKEVMPKTVFGKPTLYAFENIKLYGAEQYDAYLRHLYNDYMQLPPENQRHVHQVKAFGEERDGRL